MFWEGSTTKKIPDRGRTEAGAVIGRRGDSSHLEMTISATDYGTLWTRNFKTELARPTGALTSTFRRQPKVWMWRKFSLRRRGGARHR